MIKLSTKEGITLALKTAEAVQARLLQMQALKDKYELDVDIVPIHDSALVAGADVLRLCELLQESRPTKEAPTSCKS